MLAARCLLKNNSQTSSREAEMNVLIVDDHPIVAEYLRAATGRAMPEATVRTANTLEDALASMSANPAELVLLDLGLPGCGGIESLLRFRGAHPDARVVVITSEDASVVIRGALAAGAAGFIPKTAGPQLMVNALRLVAEGGRYIPPEVLGAEPEPAEQSDSSTPGMLTERQREVLQQLLNGRTIAQAAQELGIAEGTAKHHALAVYAAYGVSSRADLILAATRQGTGTG
jgi:two-component system, NarL family, nitrate/nitrite response regulator NarL